MSPRQVVQRGEQIQPGWKIGVGILVFMLGIAAIVLVVKWAFAV